MPATEVKKHPTSPTRTMVLREGMWVSVVMLWCSLIAI